MVVALAGVKEEVQVAQPGQHAIPEACALQELAGTGGGAEEPTLSQPWSLRSGGGGDSSDGGDGGSNGEGAGEAGGRGMQEEEVVHEEKAQAKWIDRDVLAFLKQMVGDHDLIDYLLEIFDAEGDTDGRRFLHLLMRRKVKSREYKLARDELSAVLKEQGGFTVKFWGSVREIAAKMEESLGLDAGELLLPAAFCNDAEFDNYDADQSVHVHTDPSGSVHGQPVVLLDTRPADA